MAIFFTSDTHFDSDRTLYRSRRPFNDVNEMNEEIIKNWNSMIKKDDIVYHLGDFGNFNFRKRLNGKIYLIVGNHEMKYYGDREIKHKFDFISKRYGFEEVCYNKVITIEDQKYFLTHKPSNFHRRSDYITLFGHLHRVALYKSFGVNVGQDCHFFRPVPYEEVKHLLEVYNIKYKKDIDFLV